MTRLCDIVISSLALTILLPFLIPICIILRLTGEGEVFYKQERIGQNGVPFSLMKFATMMKESPQLGAGAFTITDDPRILPLGRILRKTKINELPQIINILIGDMSIVGPRPLMQKQFRFYEEAARRKIFSRRPGLTGIGSLVFRDEERFFDGSSNPEEIYRTKISPAKEILELWYAENSNLALYFFMIFMTALAVMFPRLDVSFILCGDIRKQLNEILG